MLSPAISAPHFGQEALCGAIVALSLGQMLGVSCKASWRCLSLQVMSNSTLTAVQDKHFISKYNSSRLLMMRGRRHCKASQLDKPGSLHSLAAVPKVETFSTSRTVSYRHPADKSEVTHPTSEAAPSPDTSIALRMSIASRGHSRTVRRSSMELKRSYLCHGNY